MGTQGHVGPALAGAALAVAVGLAPGGCGELPDTSFRLKVMVPYNPSLDSRPGIPKVQIWHDARLEGEHRTAAAARTIGGHVYEGERLEAVAARTYDAETTTLIDAVAHRFAEPSPHLDLHVTSTMKWELVLSGFLGGTLRDAATGEAIAPKYIFGPGTYHLRAYKEVALPAAGAPLAPAP